MGNYERSAHMRVMVIPATAATYYPTAVTLGLSGETLKVDTDTVTTTQGSSYYASSVATVPKPGRIASIRKIEVTTALAGNITIEGHNGTAILPAMSGAALGAVLDVNPAALPIVGGFRVVTSTNIGLRIFYEVDY